MAYIALFFSCNLLRSWFRSRYFNLCFFFVVVVVLLRVDSHTKCYAKLLNRTGPGWLLCLCRAQGQRGRNAGSSICRQNSPPSGVGCFTNLPHTLTGSIRTHPHTHTAAPLPDKGTHTTSMPHAESRMRGFLKIHRHANVRHTYSIHTHWPAAPCICLVVFFFPLQWFPSQGLEDSAAPGDRTGALIDSRGFGGRGASKTALLLPLLSRPSALSVPVMHLISAGNTLRKFSTSLPGCPLVY